MRRLTERRSSPAPESEWVEAAHIVGRAAEDLDREDAILCMQRFWMAQQNEALVQCWKILEAQTTR